MTASSRAVVDLAACKDLRWLAQVAADVATAGLAQEPLVVGALARDILLLHAHGIDTGRATEDADFAIAVAGWEEFSAAQGKLLAGNAFVSSGQGLQRIRHREFGWVDLIPFGAVERTDATIAWPPDGAQVMNVLGFREACSTAIQVMLPGEQRVLVVSLPMLILLKILAWEDRHTYVPGKDALDLMLMLRKYLDAGNLSRFPEDAAELPGLAFDYETAGALLAGRDAGALLRTCWPRGEAICERVGAIVRRESDPDGQLGLLREMAGSDVGHAHRLLGAFERGLEFE